MPVLPANRAVGLQAPVPGRADLPEIRAEPLAMVVQVLTSSATVEEVFENLPDVVLLPTVKHAV